MAQFCLPNKTMSKLNIWNLRSGFRDTPRSEQPGYICDQASGRSVWCDSEDCLHYVVLRDPDDATQILVSFVDAQQDDLLISLDEFRHRFTSKVIKFTSLGTNKTVDVDARRYGAAVLWSVASLYDAVMPGIVCTASRWYQNWWLCGERRL